MARAAMPHRNEIAEFIAIFNKLERFEAEQRYVRGGGAFDPKDLPILSVRQTMAWLRQIVDDAAVADRHAPAPIAAPTNQYPAADERC